MQGIRAVSRSSPSTAPARVEQLPRHRLPRASTTQEEVSTPARSPRRPTRVGPATESALHDSLRSDKPSNPGPSRVSSQINGGLFRSPRTLAPGIISSPPALPSATLARCALSRTGNGNATGPARKGICEIQRGSGDPVRRSERETRCAASRHNQLVPCNSALIRSPMG